MKTIVLKRSRRIIVLAAVYTSLFVYTNKVMGAEKTLIFPIPQQMELTNDVFVLDESVSIIVPLDMSEKDVFLARFLVRELSDKYGIAVNIESATRIPGGRKVVVMGSVENPLIKEYITDNNLKMSEMTLTNSEPFFFFEFRHGPISMAGEPAVVIGLLSEKNREREEAVLHESEELGSQVFTLADEQADVNFKSGLPEAIRNVLYLPVLQLMAFYRSMAKGLNPDRPANLTAVVELDLE